MYMASWQPHGINRLLDSKPSQFARVLEILEATDGYTGGTSGELKRTKLLHSRPGTDTCPEPFDDLVGFLVAAVVSELGLIIPVVDGSVFRRSQAEKKYAHINLTHTSNQQLQLPLIDQIFRDELQPPAGPS